MSVLSLNWWIGEFMVSLFSCQEQVIIWEQNFFRQKALFVNEINCYLFDEENGAEVQVHTRFLFRSLGNPIFSFSFPKLCCRLVDCGGVFFFQTLLSRIKWIHRFIKQEQSIFTSCLRFIFFNTVFQLPALTNDN